MTDLTITPGSTVLIAGFDDIPSHQFLVDEVLKDCITGTALTGPLAGNTENQILLWFCRSYRDQPSPSGRQGRA